MDLAYLLKLILDITNFINIAYQASNMGVSPKEKATAIAASINLLNKVIGEVEN